MKCVINLLRDFFNIVDLKSTWFFGEFVKVFGFVLIAVFFVAANAVPGGYVSAYQPASYNKKGGSYADQNYGATYGKDYYTEVNLK